MLEIFQRSEGVTASRVLLCSRKSRIDIDGLSLLGTEKENEGRRFIEGTEMNGSVEHFEVLPVP
jgi:hypothetical protein